MSTENTVVQFESINKMLDEDPEAIKEFSEAALDSFTFFRDKYRLHMHNRNIEALQRVGHRIKPVAEMIGVIRIIDLYYEGKELLKGEGSEDKIKATTDEMDDLCGRVIQDFEAKIESIES